MKKTRSKKSRDTVPLSPLKANPLQVLFLTVILELDRRGNGTLIAKIRFTEFRNQREREMGG